MDTPSPFYIISRATFFIILVVAVLGCYSFVRKQQRQTAICAELESITSDSSFFKQFYAEDARKSLVRAIGLIAEANTLGTAPDSTISRGLGIKPQYFASDSRHEEPPAREKIIRACLRTNYENFLKLGYKANVQTLEAMKTGNLPLIPSGPQSGQKPVIATLINPSLAPGMDKVIANLELRPPQTDDHQPTAIELAAAKQLASDLVEAMLIEQSAGDKILKGLAAPVSNTPKP